MAVVSAQSTSLPSSRQQRPADATTFIDLSERCQLRRHIAPLNKAVVPSSAVGEENSSSNLETAGRIHQSSRCVPEVMQPEAMVTEVARRWGFGTGLIYIWRKQMREEEP